MSSAGKGNEALKIPAFRRFIAARFFLTMAIQMQAVAVGWQVYEITHDTLALGLIGLSEALPFMSIALFAGHWADIYERKKIVVRSVSLFALCAFILLGNSFLPETYFSAHKEYLLYFVIAITGLARGLAGPSVQAMLPQLLPRNVLANGIAWNTSAWQIAAVSGPAIGGLIYGYAGKQVTYAFCAGFVIISLSFFSSLPAFSPAKALREKMTDSLRQGIVFVLKNKIVLGALSLDLFAVLFGGAVALLPVFADQVLDTGPEGLGLLRAAPSVGAVFTALIITRFTPKYKTGVILLAAVALYGFTMIAFALSDIFILSLFMLFLSGVFDGVSVVIRSTILQLFTPDEMRGRVSSVNSIFIGSSNEIGAFESGIMAKALGLIPSVVFGGFMTVFVTGLTSLLAPSLRKLELKDYEGEEQLKK